MSNTNEIIEQAFIRLLAEALELKRKAKIPKWCSRIKRSDVQAYANQAADDRTLKTLSEITALEFIEWKKERARRKR